MINSFYANSRADSAHDDDDDSGGGAAKLDRNTIYCVWMPEWDDNSHEEATNNSIQ